MKNYVKISLGAAGLISLGAVGISYFDESIERRTMEGIETFTATMKRTLWAPLMNIPNDLP